MSALFQQFKMRALELSNRIVVSPMCQYAAKDGKATAWHSIHLGNMAISGAGMLIVEATAVEPEGRITYADLGLWCDQTEYALSTVVHSIKEYSPIPLVIQLAHAGRKASKDLPWKGGKQIMSDQPNGWQSYSSSCFPHNEGDMKPIALTKNDMNRIKKAFAEAANRADRIGFDGIEIHAAHGFLLHQFLSPLSNRRQDEYGGSLENRIRYPLEVFTAVRSAFSIHKPVGVRVTVNDWIDGGWTLEETIVLSLRLKELGVDWIDASSGGLTINQTINAAPGYQVPGAYAIKSATGLATMAVGLITEPKQAEEIITSEKADMVALGRGMLYNPRWPWHAAAELHAQVWAPPQFFKAPPQNVGRIFKQL
ncbi:oxidoreductase [Ochrobactrum sp. MYb29]|nr:oxidoreductase [Ochrobactrum sp. MYb29]